MIDLKNCEIIDLTHSMYHGMPGWPTHPILSVKPLKILNIDGYNVKELVINTHHGTHLDAPAHMLEDGKTLDQFELSKFFGEGVALDLSYKKDGEGITATDLKKFDIKRGDMVFLYTGWSKFRGFNKKYLYLWPYLTPDGADYLVNLDVKLVGTDGLSIGAWGGSTSVAKPVDSTALEVHQKLLGKEIIIAEEVGNLDKLLKEKNQQRAFFIVLPLKISESDGAPARIVAVLC